jgi:hypothetical protein
MTEMSYAVTNKQILYNGQVVINEIVGRIQKVRHLESSRALIVMTDTDVYTIHSGTYFRRPNGIFRNTRTMFDFVEELDENRLIMNNVTGIIALDLRTGEYRRMNVGGPMLLGGFSNNRLLLHEVNSLTLYLFDPIDDSFTNIWRLAKTDFDVVCVLSAHRVLIDEDDRGYSVGRITENGIEVLSRNYGSRFKYTKSSDGSRFTLWRHNYVLCCSCDGEELYANDYDNNTVDLVRFNGNNLVVNSRVGPHTFVFEFQEDFSNSRSERVNTRDLTMTFNESVILL